MNSSIGRLGGCSPTMADDVVAEVISATLRGVVLAQMIMAAVHTTS
jgi:hypothetical protein